MTDDDDSSDEVEEVVQAPSLIEMGRQLKGLQPSWLTILSFQQMMKWCCSATVTGWPKCLFLV